MNADVEDLSQSHRKSMAATIPSSYIYGIFRDVEAKERIEGNKIIKLHVGEPYFRPSAEVTEAFAQAVRNGNTRYAATEGLLELREALVEKLETDNDVSTTVSRVFVTPGSCQGLFALLLSIAEPEAEILLPEIHWPVHVQQSLLAGFRPVFYPLDSEFRPDLDAIRAVAGPRTRVMLLNSPANPTGKVLDAALLGALLDLGRSRGWQIVSDEAYEHYVYDGDHFSMAALERDTPVAERIVHSVYSFSKSAAMTGHRLGYVVTANERVAAAMRLVQEACIIGPSTPVQYAGIAAVRHRAAIAKTNHQLVLHNRNNVLPSLVAAGMLPELPAGGWYGMVNIERTGMDAEAFTARLLDTAGVAVVPGTAFAWHPLLDGAGSIRSADFTSRSRHLVRVAFCVDPVSLEDGVRNLIKFIQECAAE